MLDGLLDVMPTGVDAVTEQLRSNLVDAYKRSETGQWGTAAVSALESLITDRAEPAVEPVLDPGDRRGWRTAAELRGELA